MPTFGSLFSGIGGLDLGLERAGWECRWEVEIDDFRRGILEAHWPGVPRYADVREVATGGGERPEPGVVGGVGHGPDGGQHRTRPTDGLARVDLICGGFPCQDLSVAGRRAGLAGARSSLFFEFARIADALRPTWLLVENVPGLLSSHRGRDFAVVLATLAELGYGVCWRVLDSRHFGVPQRRRRVFVVGRLGALTAEPFLPFLEGGEGHPPAGRAQGQDAPAVSLSGLGSGGPDDNDGQAGRIVTAYTLGQNDRNRSQGRANYIAFQSRWRGDDGRGYDREPAVSEDQVHALDGQTREFVAYGWNTRRGAENDLGFTEEGTPPITQRHGDPGGVLRGTAVRRLTPVECCRLQGFPDDWLGEPNEPPDSPRYAALGDAVTVPVAEWIGRRLMEVT